MDLSTFWSFFFKHSSRHPGPKQTKLENEALLILENWKKKHIFNGTLTRTLSLGGSTRPAVQIFLITLSWCSRPGATPATFVFTTTITVG
jgi:hypothetical protein